jgi:hypothetical protein
MKYRASRKSRLPSPWNKVNPYVLSPYKPLIRQPEDKAERSAGKQSQIPGKQSPTTGRRPVPPQPREGTSGQSSSGQSLYGIPSDSQRMDPAGGSQAVSPLISPNSKQTMNQSTSGFTRNAGLSYHTL